MEFARGDEKRGEPWMKDCGIGITDGLPPRPMNHGVSIEGSAAILRHPVILRRNPCAMPWHPCSLIWWLDFLKKSLCPGLHLPEIRLWVGKLPFGLRVVDLGVFFVVWGLQLIRSFWG